MEVTKLVKKLDKHLKKYFMEDYDRIKVHQLVDHLPEMLTHYSGYRASSEPHERNNKHFRASILSGNRHYVSLDAARYCCASIAATLLLPGESCKRGGEFSSVSHSSTSATHVTDDRTDPPVGDGLRLLRPYFGAVNLVTTSLFEASEPADSAPAITGRFDGLQCVSLSLVFQKLGYESNSTLIDRKYPVPAVGSWLLCNRLRVGQVTVRSVLSHFLAPHLRLLTYHR